MAWECSDCNAREDEQGTVVVDAVCHHCGKPLCREHQMVVALDEAFAPVRLADVALPGNPGGYSPGFGVHCESCRRAHHARATLLEGPPQ